MMKHDKEIIRSVRKLATKECANWCDGTCILDDPSAVRLQDLVATSEALAPLSG